MTKVFAYIVFFIGHLIVLFSHKREHLVGIFLPNVGFTVLPISSSAEFFSHSIELDFTGISAVSLNEDIFQYEVNELMPRHIITCKQLTHTVPSTSIKQRCLLFC